MLPAAGVAPRLLALFPLLSAVRGDCPPPPKLQNAVFLNDIGTSFPEGKEVVYRCLPEFYNIRRKIDVTQCFRGAWTHIEDFCERSCPDTPRFRFARVNEADVRTYYVPGHNLSYNCHAGYDRIPGMSSVITCLQSYNWTELPVFCKRKSCGDPGNPQNGRAVIQTNLLYLSKVNFICDDGYRLIGSPSTQCQLKGTEVKWDKKLPNCKPIICMSPPNITSGTHNGTNGTSAYHTAITYKCDDGFSLVGEASLSCITENQIDGVWSGPGPECWRNPTPQDSTVATTTDTVFMLFTTRETERGSTFSGTTYNNTPISRIEKKGSRIWMVAGVSAVSSVAFIAAVVAAIRASGKRRQKKTSSYNLNRSSRSMQLPQTSWAEV